MLSRGPDFQRAAYTQICTYIKRSKSLTQNPYETYIIFFICILKDRGIRLFTHAVTSGTTVCCCTADVFSCNTYSLTLAMTEIVVGQAVQRE